MAYIWGPDVRPRHRPDAASMPLVTEIVAAWYARQRAHWKERNRFVMTEPDHYPNDRAGEPHERPDPDGDDPGVTLAVDPHLAEARAGGADDGAWWYV